MRRLITATGAGLAAAALAILFGLAGPAHAQDGSEYPNDDPTDTTATTVFAGDTDDDTLAQTGVETWVLVSGAGAALASAAGARRLLRSRI